MILAVVFAGYLALTLARTEDFWPTDARVIPWTDASELPVHLAHDFLGKFGLVKPSDDDILDYVNTVGITYRNVASGLRGLFTDPSLVLLGDDYGNVVAYYADTGIDHIDAYPETSAVFRSLLDASNTVALVYKPERFLLPSERKAVTNRFFSPANFKLRDIDVGFPENVHVVDAPVVFRKFETPIHYPRSRPYYDLFDIDRIPYAYKVPVYFRTSDISSPYWYQAMGSDANPAYDDVTYPDLKAIHTVLGGKVAPYSWGALCNVRPSWCTPSTIVPTGVNAPPTPFEPETEPSYCRIWGTSSPCVKYNRFFVNPVSFDSDKLTSFKFQPSTEQHIYKTVPPTASSVSSPPLPLVALKNVPFPRSSIPDNVPISDDIAAKRLPTTHIPIVSSSDARVIPSYVIHPEHLKAVTAPVLTSAKPTVGTPSFSVDGPVIPPYLIRPEHVMAFKVPALHTDKPTVGTPSVSVIPPYVIRPEHVKAFTLPVLSSAIPTVGTPSVSAIPSIIRPHIRPDHLNAVTVPVLPTPKPTEGIPSVIVIPPIISSYTRPDHLNAGTVPVLSTSIPTVGTSPVSVDTSVTPPYVRLSEHLNAGTVPFLSTSIPTVGTSPVSVDSSVTPPYVMLSDHLNAGTVPVLSTSIPTVGTSPVSVDSSVTPPYVMLSEHLNAGTVPVLSTSIPTVGTSPVSVDSSVTPPYVMLSEHLNAGTVPFLSTAKPTVATPTVSKPSQPAAVADSVA